MDRVDRESIKNHLNEWILEVNFTKVDGTERVMKCTTTPKLIPEDKIPKGDSDRAYSDEIQHVWDLEKEAWRAFRWDSVNHVVLLEEVE